MTAKFQFIAVTDDYELLGTNDPGRARELSADCNVYNVITGEEVVAVGLPTGPGIQDAGAANEVEEPDDDEADADDE